MPASSLHLGGYRLDAVDAGRLRLDGGAMFGIVPKALWSRHAPADDQNRITLAMRCLLLRGHGRTVLVDCGLGDRYDEKFARIYGIEHERDVLRQSLAALGVEPTDVTDVLLTHLHFDHAGGVSTRTADGALALTFPDATHHVQRRHWDWAHASPREEASFLPDHMGPLAQARLNLLDGPATPFPNVEVVVADGHTRGMQLPLVRDGADALLYAADLLPTAAHVPLLWIMAYDIAPLDTLAEKERVLAQAADEGWTVMFEHDPETVLARVARTVGPSGTPRGFEAAERRAWGA